MMSRVRKTRLSASIKSRGVEALLRATEYCSHGQLAQITSKNPLGRSLYRQSRIFWQMLGEWRGSMSRLITSCPEFLKAVAMDCVPENRSSV
jgi:hypothetical protein